MSVISSLTSTVLTGLLTSTLFVAPVSTPTGSLAPVEPRPDESASSSPTVPAHSEAKTATSVVKAPQTQTATVALHPDQVNVLGVDWAGSGNPEPEYRTQDEDGTWSSWQSLPVSDGGADPGTPDARHQSTQGSDIVPIVDATAAQVRFAKTTARNVASPEVTTVSTNVTATDKQTARRAASVNRSGTAGSGTSSSVTGLANNAVFTPEGATTEATSYHPGMKTNVVTRKEWGADESLTRCTSGVAKTARAAIVHHTAGSNTYSAAQAPGIIRGYLSFHTKERGWCDLGYNYLVDRFGTIYEGRAGSLDKPVIGAHASGFNTETVGVSVMGTFNSSAPDTVAQRSVARVIAYNAQKYGFDPTGKAMFTSGGGSTSKYPAGARVSLNVVGGHRDTSYTDCPGTAFYQRLPWLRSEAQKIQASVYAPQPQPKQVGQVFAGYYNAQGGQAKFGKPTTDQRALSNPAGYVQSFDKGAMHYSKATGVRFTWGAIQAKWKSLRWEKGYLGFPTSEQVMFKYRTGTHYQNFQGGMIVTYSKGTATLTGAIRTKWKAAGWERSVTKLPLTDQRCGLKNGGCYQRFEGGTIHWSKASGAHITKANSAIQNKWKELKYENGRLGYPTSDEYASGTAIKQNFQGGTVTYQNKKTTVSYK